MRSLLRYLSFNRIVAKGTRGGNPSAAHDSEAWGDASAFHIQTPASAHQTSGNPEPSRIVDPREIYNYEAQFRRERDGALEPKNPNRPEEQ